MSELLQLTVVLALWCWGVYNAFREGQIFEKAGNWLRNHMPEFWLKPIIGCMVCMPSIHGTVFYLAFGGRDPLVWIVHIVAASGLNFIIKEHLYED